MLICQTTRRVQVEYSSPVRDCVRKLRVFPSDRRGGQQVIDLHWSCDPAPDESEEALDGFGNRVLHLRHERIAREFVFEMTVKTTHDAGTRVMRETNLPLTGIGAFLLPSALSDFTSDIEKIVAGLRARCDSPLQLVLQACEAAHGQVEYSPGATHMSTPASQSLRLHKGVCQDQAHLMIALCRAMKIPARYVSGYIRGEGAPHAWVEAIIENHWQGFDPTHNREARRDYVFVACGRDARDCASHSGSFRGRAQARLESLCRTTITHS